MFRACLFALPVVVAAAACAQTSPEAVATESDELAAALPGVDESALDRSVDPCSNFYRFACGGYIASLPPEGDFEPTVMLHQTRAIIRLQRERNAILTRLLEDGRSAAPGSALRKAIAYYDACLDPKRSELPRLAAGPRAEIHAIQSWSDVMRVKGMLERLGANALFGLGTNVIGGAGRNQEPVVFAEGYDRGVDYSGRRGVGQRRDALRAIVREIDPALSAPAAAAIVDDTIAIETALANAAGAPDYTPDPTPPAAIFAATPSLSWSAYFDGVGVAPPQRDYYVFHANLLAGLERLVATTSLDAVRHYLLGRWYEALVTNTTLALVSAAGLPVDRQTACMDGVSWTFVDAVEAPFLELAGVDEAARRKARALFDLAAKGVDEVLADTSYLDPAARREARLKIGIARPVLGVQERPLDDYAWLEVAPGDAFGDLQLKVIAHAHVASFAGLGQPSPPLVLPPHWITGINNGDEIVVPGGSFGGFLFSPHVSDLANLAGIGTLFGHEIGHTFGPGTQRVDSQGVRRNWMSPETEREFTTRLSCMADQYSAFRLEGVPHPETGEIPAPIDGVRLLRENLPDNLGVAAAFRASRASGRTGPVVHGFSPAAQFFVGYAQLWCRKVTPEQASEQLAYDGHSPPEARVNMPLMNLRAFAETFQCAEGSPMAPPDRCEVW